MYYNLLQNWQNHSLFCFQCSVSTKHTYSNAAVIAALLLICRAVFLTEGRISLYYDIFLQ